MKPRMWKKLMWMASILTLVGALGGGPWTQPSFAAAPDAGDSCRRMDQGMMGQTSDMSQSKDKGSMGDMGQSKGQDMMGMMGKMMSMMSDMSQSKDKGAMGDMGQSKEQDMMGMMSKMMSMMSNMSQSKDQGTMGDMGQSKDQSTMGDMGQSKEQDMMGMMSKMMSMMSDMSQSKDKGTMGDMGQSKDQGMMGMMSKMMSMMSGMSQSKDKGTMGDMGKSKDQGTMSDMGQSKDQGMMGGMSKMGQSGDQGMMGDQGMTGANDCSKMDDMSHYAAPWGRSYAIDPRRVMEMFLAELDPKLSVGTILDLGNRYYAEAVEKDSGTGAYEATISRRDGTVWPEKGPNQMWNQKYGTLGTSVITGTETVTPSAMSVTKEQAVDFARRYLAQNKSGFTLDESARAFYGYYNFTVLKDGKPASVISVNGYSGRVWYHSWLEAAGRQAAADCDRMGGDKCPKTMMEKTPAAMMSESTPMPMATPTATATTMTAMPRPMPMETPMAAPTP